MTPDAHSSPNAGTILLGPGTAIPVGPYESGQSDDASTRGIAQTIAHALRRRWFSVAVLGLIACAAGTVGGWYGLETQYTASARVIVPPDSAATFGDRQRDGNYDLRKRTHLQMVSGPVILGDVLGRDEVRELRIIRNFDLDEQQRWLKSRISANFLGDSQIMEIRVRSPDRYASITLANAIQEKFIEDARADEDNEREARIDSLEKTLIEHKREFQDEQNRLANRVLAGQPDAARPLTSDELLEQRGYERKLEQVAKLNEAIWQAEFRLNALTKTVQENEPQDRPEGAEDASDAARPDSRPSLVSDEELHEFLESDQFTQDAEKRIETLEQAIASGPERYRGESLDLFVKVCTRKLEQTRDELADHRKETLLMLERRKREALGTEAPLDPETLKTQVAAFEQERDRLQVELRNIQPPQQQTAGPSLPQETEILMMQLRLEPLKQVIADLQRLIDESDVTSRRRNEAQTQTGIRKDGSVLLLDRADSQRKMIQSGALGGVAFLAAAALVVLFDLRRGRLNHTDDVSERLRINVLGTIPLLKGKGSKRLESSQRLAESVDGVAAALLCQTTGDSHRVVMISSAMPGEGKTTLAANLATSLAAAGRRTLLVDFDLRRPMLHKVYQCSIGPGVGEVLSGGEISDAVDYVEETGSENLWLITAGARRQGALVELAGDRVAELFEELKEHFEYIIVDSPPVLPVVDTRLVARHADGVVMSMLRDVSELSKVKSACQLLQSYRVTLLGAVVIGASGDVYYGYAPSRVSTSA